jgi:hypothetical protein
MFVTFAYAYAYAFTFEIFSTLVPYLQFYHIAKIQFEKWL